MAVPCCVTCGRALPKPKAIKVAFTPLTPDMRAGMTDNQIHAFYKATSHVEDVRFAIKHGITTTMPAELAEGWRILLAEAESGLKRSETHKRLWSLTQTWRQYRNDQDQIKRNARVLAELARVKYFPLRLDPRRLAA